MSSGFGSNIKDKVVSSNRSRPKVVGSSSGYGQQLKKKQSSSFQHENAGNRYQQRAPPQFAETNEPQKGKIKAFIDLDAIPDEYGVDDNKGKYVGVGGRIATHQSNFQQQQQQPSSLYQPHSSNNMYGVRDAYQELSDNNYMTDYKSTPTSQVERREMNIIPRMGAMRAMQPDAAMQQQFQQQPPSSSRRTPPPPLPADRPTTGGSKSNHNFAPGSPEDRERRRLVNQVRISTKAGSNSNNGGKSRGVYSSSSEKWDNDDDDDDWGNDEDYYDGNDYDYGDKDVNRYNEHDYRGNSDYDADADGSDSYGRGSYAQHTRIKKPSKNTSSVSGGKAPPPLPVEVSPPKNYNEGRAMNNPKDRLAFSKAPRNVDYQPNTKPITRGDYVEIQNLKPDLNREELVVKRVNAERVKEFAKNLQEYNRQALQQQRKLPSSKESKSIQDASKKMESKRAKALEFAKRVPKPKVKQDSETAIARENDNGKKFISRRDHEDEAYLVAGDEFGTDFEVAGKIQSLELKHEESRRQVDAIKKSMGILK